MGVLDMQGMAGLVMAGVGEFIQVGILTSSDRASSGEYEDLSGPAIRGFFEEALLSEWNAVSIVVADEQKAIEAALIDLIDVQGCNLVVTTGGTGPAPRDVTPDATEAVCSRMLPGFGEQMRAVSLRYVPTAILSRQSAGIRGQALIINLPGAPKAIRETIDEIFAAVPYCIDLIGGPYIETDPTVVDAFRPKHTRR
jgi:molybdopterin adenylyltransferase